MCPPAAALSPTAPPGRRPGPAGDGVARIWREQGPRRQERDAGARPADGRPGAGAAGQAAARPAAAAAPSGRRDRDPGRPPRTRRAGAGKAGPSRQAGRRLRRAHSSPATRPACQGKSMSTTDIDLEPAAVSGWHAPMYFDAASRDTAHALRERVIARFGDRMEMGRFHEAGGAAPVLELPDRFPAGGVHRDHDLAGAEPRRAGRVRASQHR